MISRILAASGIAALLFAAPAMADDNLTTGSTNAQDDGGMTKNPGNQQQPEPGVTLEGTTGDMQDDGGMTENPGNAQQPEPGVTVGGAASGVQDDGGMIPNPGNDNDPNN